MRMFRSAAVAIAATLLLTACTTPTTTPSAGQSSAGHASGDHNATDTMFAQMMIPHHEDAIVMAEVLLEREDAREETRDLAERIAAAQAEENAQMDDWLVEHTGAASMMSGAGSMMSSGANETRERARAAADGVATAAVEEQFLEQMIAHHDHGVDMAASAVDGGRSATMIDLAAAMVEVQTAEIEEMQGLLADA